MPLNIHISESKINDKGNIAKLFCPLQIKAFLGEIFSNGQRLITSKIILATFRL